MRTSIIYIFSSITLLFASIVVFYTPLNAAETCSPTCLIQEYSVPGSPLKIVAGETNQIWYTLPLSNSIGSLITIESGTVVTASTFVIPTAESQPYDLVYDNDASAIWFTQKAVGKIGRLEVETGDITEFQIPTPDSAPTGIDIAPDGTIWFAESGVNKLGRFLPDSSTFEEFAYVPRNISGSAELEEVVVENNLSIWFTAPRDHEVVQFRPDEQPDKQFAPTFFGINRRPVGVAISADGTLWATDAERGEIRKYVAGTLATWIQFPLSSPDSEPLGIEIISGSVDQIFTAARTSGALVQMTDGQGAQDQVRQHGLADGASPTDIAADNLGTIWAADSGRNTIIRWQSPYFLITWLPLSIAP